jgi:hypothetical protein
VTICSIFFFSEHSSYCKVCFFFFYLFLWFLSGLSSSSSSCSGGGSDSGSSGLKSLSLLEAEFSFVGNGDQILEGVSDEVREGGLDDVSRSEGGAGDVSDCFLEGSEELVGLDVEYLGVNELSVVVNVLDFHLVSEGGDLQLVE